MWWREVIYFVIFVLIIIFGVSAQVGLFLKNRSFTKSRRYSNLLAVKHILNHQQGLWFYFCLFYIAVPNPEVYILDISVVKSATLGVINTFFPSILLTNVMSAGLLEKHLCNLGRFCLLNCFVYNWVLLLLFGKNNNNGVAIFEQTN